ncbi:MAG TPA: flagellar hook-length control protein FliK [candidate division Zixibacteria bacterium]|nr:flagellar hook-length control protein FliK [candidate division Zixibacteria bacterium]
MTFTPTNIMNLPGASGGPTGNGNAGSTPGSAASAGLLFGDIISGLLLGGANAPAQLPFAQPTNTGSVLPNLNQGLVAKLVGSEDPAAKAMLALLTGSPAQQAGLLDGAAGVENGENPLTINSGAIPNLIGIEDSDVIDIISDPSAKPSARTHAFNQDVVSLLPQQALVMNQNVKNVMAEIPVDLPSGKYDVVSSQVADGKLQLQVVSQDNPGQPITLSISLDALKDLGIDKSGVAPLPKLDLGVTNTTQQDFAGLVNKLNLTSIEINQTSANQPQSSPNTTVSVSLFGGATGSELMLRAQLSKSQVRASVNDNREGKQAPKTDVTSIVGKTDQTMTSQKGDGTVSTKTGTTPQGKTSGTNVQDASTSAIPQAQQQGTESDIKQSADALKEKLQESLGQVKELIENNGKSDKSATKITTDKIEPFLGTHKTSIDNSSVDGKKPLQPVRFVLPEDIKSALKPVGREVTLHIEPEHLGPARLSLSLHDDGLSARLVVNTTNAKTTLEGSLDKLMAQLAKADIKVQQIQVTVSGEAPQQHLFQRQPDWSRSNRFGRNRIADEDSAEENIMQVTYSPAARGGYVGSGRVDLLA